jgi:hypothetical protein
MQIPYSYAQILSAAEKVKWQVDDLLPVGAGFDFRRPFLPRGLAPTEGLAFLGAEELLTLNQVRAHAYLGTFGLVEEFILPFVLDHARPAAAADEERTRALIGFAAEEAKHIQLFRRFRAAFATGFGRPCGLIGPAEAVARQVLANPPLAVALLVLHIEWMTQRHWLECAQDDGDLEPRFKALLRHHWMEEAQHAKLDANMVAELGATLSAAEVLASLEAYLAIAKHFAEAFDQQAQFDVESLRRATGRQLEPAAAKQLLAQQRRANRQVYLVAGMTHPRFLASLDALHPFARPRVEAAAQALA